MSSSRDALIATALAARAAVTALRVAHGGVPRAVVHDFDGGHLEAHAQRQRWSVERLELVRALLATACEARDGAFAAIAAVADGVLGSLDRLNDVLRACDRDAQPSLTAARAEARRVYLNIWDLVAERYARRFTSFHALRRDVRKRPFPKDDAKPFPHLRAFLKVLG